MLVNHLAGCGYQPQEVRARAQDQKGHRSPRRHRHAPAAEGALASSSRVQLTPPPYPTPTFHVRSPSDSQQPAYMLSVSRPALSSRSSFVSTSSSSLAPSDSISVRSSVPPSRSRRGHRRTSSPSPVIPELSWSDGRQAYFEDRITRLTASAGLPLSWIENPEWLNFCTEFLPQAKSPSRKVLTRRLLPRTLAGFQGKAMERASGRNATASCDGWTGENYHHYIAFMIMVEKEVQIRYLA